MTINFSANSPEAAIALINESGIETTSADLALIEEANSGAFRDGYANGVNVEMGDGKPVDFESYAVVEELIKNLSFSSTVVLNYEVVEAIREMLDLSFSGGSSEGSWDC